MDISIVIEKFGNVIKNVIRMEIIWKKNRRYMLKNTSLLLSSNKGLQDWRPIDCESIIMLYIIKPVEKTKDVITSIPKRIEKSTVRGISINIIIYNIVRKNEVTNERIPLGDLL